MHEYTSFKLSKVISTKFSYCEEVKHVDEATVPARWLSMTVHGGGENCSTEKLLKLIIDQLQDVVD